MDKSLKRIVAYFIDIMIVSIIVSLIGNIKAIPQNKEYQENFAKYTELLNKYQDEKISEDEYNEQMITINYDLSKSNVISNSATIVLLFLYFGVCQVLSKGQTLGKKFLKLKTVNKDDSNLTMFRSLLRTFILNNVLFRILLIVGVYFLNAKQFNDYSYIISVMEGFVEATILVMVILRQDGRGLHDLIAGTKVIDLNVNDVAEVKAIEEAKVSEKPQEKEEPKKTPKKKESSKSSKKTKTVKKETSKNTK